MCGSDCLIISGKTIAKPMQRTSTCKGTVKNCFRIKYGPVLVQVSQETDLLKRGEWEGSRGKRRPPGPAHRTPLLISFVKLVFGNIFSQPPLLISFVKLVVGNIFSYTSLFSTSSPRLLPSSSADPNIIFLPASFTIVLYMLFLEEEIWRNINKGFLQGTIDHMKTF